MTYALRSELYATTTGGRTIFLDARRNRYFCLSESLEAEFNRYRAGERVDQNSDLLSKGILTLDISGDRRDAPIAVPIASALDSGAKAKMSDIVVLLGYYFSARALVARRPSTVLTAAQTSDPTIIDRHDADEELRRIASAYQSGSRLLGAHDLCLPWSMAVTRLCRHRRLMAQTIVGVSARPFRAHSWSQCGEYIVNDHFDFVRNFSPILAL